MIGKLIRNLIVPLFGAAIGYHFGQQHSDIAQGELSSMAWRLSGTSAFLAMAITMFLATTLREHNRWALAKIVVVTVGFAALAAMPIFATATATMIAVDAAALLGLIALFLATITHGLLPQPYETAIHEAGHVVAFWRCRTVRPIEVTIIPDGIRDGKVITKTLATDCTDAECWRMIIALAAGAEAQRLYGGLDRAGGSSSDRRKEKRLIASMRREVPELIMPWNGQRVSEVSTHRIMTEVHRSARRFVIRHEAHVKQVAAAVLRRGTLTESNLQEILGPPGPRK